MCICITTCSFSNIFHIIIIIKIIIIFEKAIHSLIAEFFFHFVRMRLLQMFTQTFCIILYSHQCKGHTLLIMISDRHVSISSTSAIFLSCIFVIIVNFMPPVHCVCAMKGKHFLLLNILSILHAKVHVVWKIIFGSLCIFLQFVVCSMLTALRTNDLLRFERRIHFFTTRHFNYRFKTIMYYFVKYTRRLQRWIRDSVFQLLLHTLCKLNTPLMNFIIERSTSSAEKSAGFITRLQHNQMLLGIPQKMDLYVNAPYYYYYYIAQ